MEQWMDGWMDGLDWIRLFGWVDGWIGWMDGWMGSELHKERALNNCLVTQLENPTCPVCWVPRTSDDGLRYISLFIHACFTFDAHMAKSMSTCYIHSRQIWFIVSSFQMPRRACHCLPITMVRSRRRRLCLMPLLTALAMMTCCSMMTCWRCKWLCDRG